MPPVCQKVRSSVDMKAFAQALQEEKATKMTERQLNVLSFVSKSAKHQDIYAE
jgi:hypothetical protein